MTSRANGGDPLAGIAFGHDDIAGDAAGVGLSGDALQRLFRFLLHFGNIEVGNRAGVERNGLAWGNHMHQRQRAAAGARLRDGMRNQIVRVRQIGCDQDLVRNHESAAVDDSLVEGFHGEKPPAGESPATLFDVAVTAGTSGCDGDHERNELPLLLNV